MIDVALIREKPWPRGKWSHLVRRAVTQSVSKTLHAVVATTSTTIEISIRLTSDAEVRTLNKQYRQQDKPTNVLSFPMVQPDLIATLANTDDGEVLLGDIVLAYETCAREAAARNVPVQDHATHLIVHGVLHLLGYDHMTDADAEAMEAIEQSVMATLGLHDPYPIQD